MLLKNIYGENIHFPHFSHSLFAFCAFAWVFLCLLVLFVLLVLLVRAKSFRKKKIIIKNLKLPNNLIYITTDKPVLPLKISFPNFCRF